MLSVHFAVNLISFLPAFPSTGDTRDEITGDRRGNCDPVRKMKEIRERQREEESLISPPHFPDDDDDVLFLVLVTLYPFVPFAIQSFPGSIRIPFDELFFRKS